MRRKDKLLHITKLNKRLNEANIKNVPKSFNDNGLSNVGPIYNSLNNGDDNASILPKLVEHHSGEYDDKIMSMTISDFLDTLKAKDKIGYEVVEKVIEHNFSESVNENKFSWNGKYANEGDKEDYHYPFDEPERDEDDTDPYNLKEKAVGLPGDLEIVPEDCGCSLDENEPTDVDKSQWFSDTDGERLTDKCMDC